jgi:hypothetical protein
MKRLLGLTLALILTPLIPGGPALAAPDISPGNVATLVVDDFGLGKDRTKPGATDENCTIGANDVGSNGAGDDLPPSLYAHGELVYRVLEDEMTADLGSAPVASTSIPRPVPGPPIESTTDWAYPINGKPYSVRLVAVHVGKYRTEDVLNGVRAKMAELRKQGFDRFVLNLSFVVVPCDVVGWLNNADLNELLATYDDMIDNDSTGALKAGLAGYLGVWGHLDPVLVRLGGFTTRILQVPALAPLRTYLAESFYRTINVTEFTVKQGPVSAVHDDRGWKTFSGELVQPGVDGAKLKVIPVGAAGNGVRHPDPSNRGGVVRVGLPFPFAPALWDFVVSTGAAAEPKIADRLNSGEVALDGSGPAKLVPDSFGTSFAAPRLSALETKYLAETGSVVCGGEPPLGYVDMSSAPVYNLNVNSPWKNWRSDTWPKICPAFPHS